MKLYEFLAICDNYDKLLDYLIDHRVMRGSARCFKCNNVMDFNRTMLLFRCYNVQYVRNKHKKRIKSKCNFKLSALHNTWFSQSHLDLQTICRFVAYFLTIRSPRQQFLQCELELSAHSIVDWSSFCRELCIQWVDSSSEKIGGEGEMVEIDEAKIGKRKYNKGRLVQGQWIFGGIQRSTKQLFIEPVDDRSANTLLHVIKKWIKPGTTIMSDCWKSYKCLNDEGYKHLTVNHKMNFIDPISGANTQQIERAWRDTRANIPRFGTRKAHYIGYLAEFMFRRRYNYDERIDAFFNIMQNMYPLSEE